MSMPSIPPIQPVEPSAAPQRAAPVSAAVSVEASQAAATKAPETQPARPAASEGKERIRLSDVRLKFVQDEETKEMTIYVLDRASHEVLRTIPPKDFNQLNAGDLLELFA